MHAALRGIFLGGFVFVLLGTAAGCDSGPRTSTVTGKVTYGGAPVANGTLTFQPQDQTGIPGSAKITDGQYIIKTLPAGKYKVLVEARPEEAGSAATMEERMQHQKADMKKMMEMKQQAMKNRRKGVAIMEQALGGIPNTAPGNGAIHEITGSPQELDIVVQKLTR
jgi:hypothetical protein